MFTFRSTIFGVCFFWQNLGLFGTIPLRGCARKQKYSEHLKRCFEKSLKILQILPKFREHLMWVFLRRSNSATQASRIAKICEILVKDHRQCISATPLSRKVVIIVMFFFFEIVVFSKLDPNLPGLQTTLGGSSFEDRSEQDGLQA